MGERSATAVDPSAVVVAGKPLERFVAIVRVCENDGDSLSCVARVCDGEQKSEDFSALVGLCCTGKSRADVVRMCGSVPDNHWP